MRYIPFLLLSVIIMVMVVATFVEKATGSAATIYGSWWFASLWAMVVAVSLIYILRRRMQQRPFLLLLHLSFVIILVGALVTHIWGKQGAIHLREGIPTRDYVLTNHQVDYLPFSVELKQFEVVCYPGTQTPMDYISTIVLDGKQISISMNHIGELEGYRFYQSSYDADKRGTVLSVSYDPWGIGITYTGYALLFVSMILLLVLPNEGFRQSLKRLSVVLATITVLTTSAFAKPEVLPDSLANNFGSLFTYYNGRICPIQTVARDFTSKLYGKPTYQGYSAEQVFSGWILYPTQWMNEPRKKAKNERYSAEQEAIIEMLLNGQFLKIFPYKGEWYSLNDPLPLDIDDASGLFIKKSMDYVAELAITKDYGRLSYTLSKIQQYQCQQAADVLPSAAALRAERIYNSCHATRPLAMVFATLGIMLFFVYLSYWLKEKSMSVWLLKTINLIVTLALVYQLTVLCLRWFVSGHLPLSNGYETMQFMAAVSMVLSLFLQRRFVLIMPFGILLTGLTLLVSMMGESNPQITPLMPVLHSPLLSLHVCIIMLAYSLLAFTFFNGLTALWLKDTVKVEHLQQVSRLLLFPALFCMAGGIFIGAIWANVSWGRYWGWDPKEVWALITLLVYCFALHSQSLPWFRRPKAFHAFMVIAFLTVLMTYFGVNFILGGMHSYANS